MPSHPQGRKRRHRAGRPPKFAKRLLGKGLVPAEEIEGVISTGQWSGTVPVDQGGNVLANAIIWMDSRGAPYINKMMDGPVKIQGYALHKLWKWIRRAGGLPASAGKDSTAHILYIKHVHPELYQQVYKFLEPVDYIGLRLTGCFASSYNTITLHWLTDNRDIHNIHYDRDLIELATLDPQKLPELKPTNAILGTLQTDIARAWGLREDVSTPASAPSRPPRRSPWNR